MTGDIINLRTARKQRKRADKERKAAENRRVFGQTKSERTERKADLERKAKTLDGHLRLQKESEATEELNDSDAAPATIVPGEIPGKDRPQ